MPCHTWRWRSRGRKRTKPKDLQPRSGLPLPTGSTNLERRAALGGLTGRARPNARAQSSCPPAVGRSNATSWVGFFPFISPFRSLLFPVDLDNQTSHLLASAGCVGLSCYRILHDPALATGAGTHDTAWAGSMPVERDIVFERPNASSSSKAINVRLHSKRAAPHCPSTLAHVNLLLSPLSNADQDPCRLLHIAAGRVRVQYHGRWCDASAHKRPNLAHSRGSTATAEATAEIALRQGRRP